MSLFDELVVEVLGTAELILELLNKIEDWAEGEGYFPKIMTAHEALDKNRIGIFHISISGVPEEKSREIEELLKLAKVNR